ncbi:ribonuclease HII [Candidatus Parcubacteria bacterium]|nr:ribonuclease HII [Candidatus Parcubacteria bacterium]
MKFLLGVDEAGRGPLAGPVAVGIVRAPMSLDLVALFPGLRDSKQLSEKKREALYARAQEEVRKGSIAIRVCFSSERMIDGKGIVYAVKHAACRGIRVLASSPQEVRVVLDGALTAPKEYEQETIIGGDGTVPVIMLASVIAKVARDRLMKKLGAAFPEYGFERHKGYGTPAHRQAIQRYGLSHLHRRSFCTNVLNEVR